MLLIADAHVTDQTSAAFFQMLDRIGETAEDLLFMGDTFDIWVGIDRLEHACHRKFLQWCLTQKEKRNIYFLEGNHEFSVLPCRSHAFTRAARELQFGDTLFLHGENLTLWRFGLTRIVLAFGRSGFCRLLQTYLPGAETITTWVKRLMGHNPMKKHILPAEKIKRSAARILTRHQANRLIIGHFHEPHALPLEDGRECFILPAWSHDGLIAKWTPENPVPQLLTGENLQPKEN